MQIKKSADTSLQLHPLLQERWSPRAFDGTHRIVDEDLNAILEAGRWSPSANNFQPWRFIVGKRGSKNFDSISETLKGFNQAWAPYASAYIVLAAVMKNDDGFDRPGSLYDLGIASAFMTMEANHRDFAVHQVGGFEKAALKSTFNLDPAIEPVVILVIGKQAPADSLSDETLKTRETSSRARKALSELIIARD
jgi:nitroreductase